MRQEFREAVRKMEAPFAPRVMLPLAIADSIDALAAGVSFAFLMVDILPAILTIGLTTFAFSVAGVKIGNHFGPNTNQGLKWWEEPYCCSWGH